MRTRMFFSAVLLSTGLFAAIAYGADHLDSPSVTDDKSTDITDVFAWMTKDAGKLNLVMGVFPSAGEDAKFSDSAQYVFHVKSQAAYGAEDADTTTVRIICTFKEDQTISCWSDGDHASGDASDAAGLTSNNGTFKVFAGRRNDPFFFNLEGLTDTVAFVKENAGDLDFQASGCPILDAAASTAILSRLTKTNEGTEPVEDAFEGTSILAIVVQIDKAAVNKSGDLLSVYGSTHSAE